MAKNVTVALKCRYCGESLMDETHQIDDCPGVKLKVRKGDKYAAVWLSSVFGSSKIESEMEFAKGEIVVLACSKCSAEATTTQKCNMCGAPMVMFKLSDGGKVRICSRNGCKNLWLDL